MNEPITTAAELDRDRARGLYGKFDVRRTDPDSEKRHQGCDYFVLDLSHDPHAAAAIAAYSDSCRADFPHLAADLDAKVGGPAVLPTEAEVAQALRDAYDPPHLNGLPPVAADRAAARAVLAMFASQLTEAAVRADEALLIAGHQDEGRGFDQLLRRQMEDLEVRAGYVAERMRRIKAEALRGFQPRCPVHDMPDCSPLLNGCSLPAVIRTQLDEEADRIESEG